MGVESSSSVPSDSSHKSRLLDELNPLPTDLRLHENQDQQTKVQPKTEEEKDGKQQHPEDHPANQTRPPPSTAAAETTTNTRSSSSLSTIASHYWWIPRWWLPDCRRRQRPKSRVRSCPCWSETRHWKKKKNPSRPRSCVRRHET